MKNLIVATALLILSSSSIYCQPGYAMPNYVTFDLVTTWPSQLTSQDEPYIVLIGSPYSEDGYKTGNVIIEGKVDFTAPMRYNSAKGVVEFLGDDKVVKEMLRRPYIKANIGGKIYEILEFIEGGETKKGYFNALSFGRSQLLYKPEKKVIIEEWSGNKLETRAYYKDISGYYVKLDGQPARAIKLDKKSILNSFEAENRKIIEFAIEKQDLNLTKEADVTRLLQYYDTLKRNASEMKEMQS